MAWQWSHTEQAYHNAKENLYTLDKQTLAECLVEWKLRIGVDVPDYDSLVEMYKGLLQCQLVEKVWDFMSSYEHGRTCDNLGFDAWVDPDGYVTVPFDLIEQ
jgi:hypothetical protein